MVREVAISIYLALFRLIFTICKMFPQKEKTVCVSSFGDNIHYSTQSLRSISDQDIIYLKDRSCTYPFDTSIGTVIPFTMRSEEHTSELQSRFDLVCRLLLEKQ